MSDTDDGHGRLLGEITPARGVQITLHERDGEVYLVRHRRSTYAGAEATIAARVAGAQVDWDHWHREHRPVWMPTVEDWARETLVSR